MLCEKILDYKVNFKFYNKEKHVIGTANEMHEKYSYRIVNDCRNFCLKHKYGRFNVLLQIIKRNELV